MHAWLSTASVFRRRPSDKDGCPISIQRHGCRRRRLTGLLAVTSLALVGVVTITPGGGGIAQASGVKSTPPSRVLTARPGTPVESCNTMVLTQFLPTVADPAYVGTTLNTATRLSSPVNYCRLDGTIMTRVQGELNPVRFMVALPDNFNGRYLLAATGGAAGAVPNPPAQQLLEGFAISGTDQGSHPSNPLDFSWEKDPAQFQDFLKFGVHFTAIVTQALTRSYYGEASLVRYIAGCSGGGSSGRETMQNYGTSDFDGVIVGANPAGGGLLEEYGRIEQYIATHSGSWIPPDLLAKTQQAILKKYDGADGTVDGIIQDDRNFVTWSSSGAINLNPAVLTQAGLSPAQIAAFDLIASWMPFVGPSQPPVAGGLYPGFAISRVDQWSTWFFGSAAPVPNNPTPWTFGSPSAPLAYDVIASMMQAIFPQNPNWIFNVDFTSPTLQQQFDQFDGVQGPPADYNQFRNQGGKVLFYVGVGDTADEYLGDVTDYYQMLQYELQDLGKNPRAGQNGRALNSLQSWARQFLVPAWGHCSPAGGPGPDGSGTVPSSRDVPNQALNAMIAWVERGRAPDSLVVANSTTSRTFRLCPEPETAVFKGGNVNKASNWTCRTQRDFLKLKWMPGAKAR